jgi:hypothetical protein
MTTAHLQQLERFIMLRFFIVLCVLFSFAWSCDTRITSQCADAPKNQPEEPGPEVNFSYLQANLFNSTCALGGCHAGARPAANLNLTSGKSYASLVNVNSSTQPDKVLVRPGDKVNSVLFQMLNDGMMPPSGKLSQSIIDPVGIWIDSGALNN